MIDKNEGHIVNMGSTAGIYAYPNGAVYCATKAAVKTLSDGIRMDTIATDIKVTTIQPGIVETPFSEVRFHGDAERAKSVYAGIEAVQPEDVADVVLYVTNLPKLSSIKLFLMYHKACRLLVRHNGHIRDLQAFRLVRYI